MRIGSLFSGIGGLELGLQWAGLGPVVWQVESDEYRRSKLAQRWPGAVRYDDVRTVGAANLQSVHVVCGGFPCQDLSVAGKGAGLDGERSGLWREFERIVRELRPPYVVVENVPALLDRGADRVLGGLAQIGYDAVWTTLRASDVGSPQERERLFIVAWLADPRRGDLQRGGGPGAFSGAQAEDQGPGDQRQRLRHPSRDGCQAARQRAAVRAGAPAESRLGRLLDGLSGWLARWPAGRGQPQLPWEPSRTAAPGRPDRLAQRRALGNAVVPAVAMVVGEIVLQIAEQTGGLPAKETDVVDKTDSRPSKVRSFEPLAAGTLVSWSAKGPCGDYHYDGRIAAFVEAKRSLHDAMYALGFPRTEPVSAADTSSVDRYIISDALPSSVLHAFYRVVTATVIHAALKGSP